jgi:hypothetical protein
MFNIVGNLLGGVVNTVGDVVKRDQQIKKIKEKGKLDIQQAKVDLDLAKLKAQIKQQATQAHNDMTYDMQVLKNRRESFIDEFIILGFFVIMILTFIPATQATMAEGWKALNDTAWWFEFGIVGILVSTLGLKDVLRIFVGGSIDKLKKKTVNDNNKTVSRLQEANNLNQSNSTPLEYDLIFDVVDTCNDQKLGNLCIGANVWQCTSGGYGKGPLPKGMYIIDKCYTLKKIMIEKKDKDGKVIMVNKVEAYTGKEFAWVAKLSPQFETDRTGLLIHPDGNLQGTRGCIGISQKENDIEVYNSIKELLKVKKELILYVNS